MKDFNEHVAKELQIIETLNNSISSFKPSDEDYQENLIKSLEYLAVCANECLESRAEYDAQNKECLELREEYTRLEREVAYARSSIKNSTLKKNKEFYDSFLKDSLSGFKEILDKYKDKFEDSVDDKAKANYDGINLIYNSYKNSLVFVGLHNEEEELEELTEESVDSSSELDTEATIENQEPINKEDEVEENHDK